MGFALLFRFECSPDVDLAELVPVWPEVMGDRYYRWLDRRGFTLQVPIAALFFVAFGWPGIVWGIGVRLALTHDGFWEAGGGPGGPTDSELPESGHLDCRR